MYVQQGRLPLFSSTPAHSILESGAICSPGKGLLLNWIASVSQPGLYCMEQENCKYKAFIESLY